MKTTVMILCLALCGCETMQRYPRTTAFVAASIALTVGIKYGGGGGGREEDREVARPVDPPRDQSR